MMNNDTTNATIIPTSRTISSFPPKSNPYFRSFNKLAPNITGIAMKNVNCAAVLRLTPITNAPRIVDPERDVPGNTAATS